jgi:protein O-mannosyl-transferase
MILAGGLVYLNSVSAPFIFDDQTAILNNPQIRQLWPLSIPLSPRPDTPVAGRPLVNLTFAINYAIGGLEVSGYRLTNIAIHLLSALTLFGLVRRTLLLSSLSPTFGAHAADLAWVAAAAWMLHPMATETIDYVTQRTESMMGLFYLLTMYCSARALDARPGRWQAAAFMACAMGMACKESMVTAPVMVVLYDWVFVAPAVAEKKHRVRLYVGLAATWLLLAAFMVSGPRTTVGFATKVSGWTYLLNQAPILLTYLRVAFWPRDLVLDYGLPQGLTLTDVWLPAIIVVGLVVATFALLARRQYAGFLGAWFFIILSPTSTIVPIATEVGAERRMYLPLAALVVLVVIGAYRAWTIWGLPQDRRTGAATAVVVCLLLSAATVERNREYQSRLSILQTTVERRPHPRAYEMLATALHDAGRREEAIGYLEMAKEDPIASFMLGVELVADNQLVRGAEEFERFVQLEPAHSMTIEALESLGRVYAALGRLDQAEARLNEVVQKDPRRIGAHQQLGGVLLRQGRTAEGVRQFQIATELEPHNAEAHRLLGIALGETHQLESAATSLKRAIDLDPSNARSYYLLGRALAAMGQVAAAVPYFARAVALDPQDAQAREDLRRAEASVK